MWNHNSQNTSCYKMYSPFGGQTKRFRELRVCRHTRTYGSPSTQHPLSLHVSSPLTALTGTYVVRCTHVWRAVYVRTTFDVRMCGVRRTCMRRSAYAGIGMRSACRLAYTPLWQASLRQKLSVSQFIIIKSLPYNQRDDIRFIPYRISCTTHKITESLPQP